MGTQTSRPLRVDVAVIGAGVEGAMAAWWVSQSGAIVALIDPEPRTELPTPGRSCAVLSDLPMRPSLIPLAEAGNRFLDHPPIGFATRPLTDRIGVVWVARQGGQDHLERVAVAAGERQRSLRRLGLEDLRNMVPGLRPSSASGGGLLEVGGGVMDLAAVVDGVVRSVTAAGGQVIRAAPVQFGRRRHGRWVLDAGELRIDAAVVINAAGPRADDLAERCGVPPLRLRRFGRTHCSVIVAADGQASTNHWPMVVDLSSGVTFGRAVNGLTLSWAHNHRVDPDDFTVARSLAVVAETTTFTSVEVRHAQVTSDAAARDGLPVVGRDPAADGFVWTVGAGDGLAMTPALGALTAAEALGTDPPSLVSAVDGGELSMLHTARLRA